MAATYNRYTLSIALRADACAETPAVEATVHFNNTASEPMLVELHAEDACADDSAVLFAASLDVELPEIVASAEFRVDGAGVASVAVPDAGGSPAAAADLPKHVIAAGITAAPVRGSPIDSALGTPSEASASANNDTGNDQERYLCV
ncbi:hypothetical protein H4R19_001041 [Coemansia spiralis]|nr:hypothetical protein H4R19_001041 [Coemansia spiralis]